MNLSVTIPNNWIPERKYILDFVFETTFGIQYELKTTGSSSCYRVCFDEKQIVIADAFFGSISEPTPYYSEYFLPKVHFSVFPFSSEKDIVILYGDSTCNVSDNVIKCGVDIFASIFFMLTRWEEYAVNKLDGHNRFPASASISFKHNFLHRPIVNEYIEMLWRMMIFLGYNGNRKQRYYQIIPTHDIDHFRMSNRIFYLSRAIAKNIFRGKSFPLLSYLVLLKVCSLL